MKEKDPFGIQGYVSRGFEAVREAFTENFVHRRELGGACCAFVRGEKVVKKGQELTRDVLQHLRHSDILKLRVSSEAEEQLNEIVDKTERQIEVLKTLFAETLRG